MIISRTILLAGAVVLFGGACDLYLVTLADQWAVRKVGAIGELYSAFFLFLPKLIFGLLVGAVTELVARRLQSKYFRLAVLLGFVAYFTWKFQIVEVWIAPGLIAYALALGPYLAFFLAFGGVVLLMKRRMHAT